MSYNLGLLVNQMQAFSKLCLTTCYIFAQIVLYKYW